jgi:recombination protein RecR
MSIIPKAITKLIESFEKLPGIGPKSAARLTFYLLHVPQGQLEDFAQALSNLKKNTVECIICCNVSETSPCEICQAPERDQSLVCVVEQPIDIISFERMGQYKGLYHVLHGALNPLANIGPDEIRINELLKRAEAGTVKELIIATNLSTEGEATAMYIRRQLGPSFANASAGEQKSDGNEAKNGHTPIISRLAHGLPLGADVQYADEYTLKEAFSGRRSY